MEPGIVDTTLRDGEQRAGIALRVCDKVQIAKILDSLGIYQIEAGIPAMGGDEKKSIYKILSLNLRAKISTWNRMDMNDIKHSIDCNPDIIHISVPASDIQIIHKLRKSREWVLSNMKNTINVVKEKGFEVTIGFEDASRADFSFLLELMREAYNQGVRRVRYADTVGILYRMRVNQEIGEMSNLLKDMNIEIHAHNDLGMAVSNSLEAIKSGAKYVDSTIGGIGERAGNCDFLKLVEGGKGFLGIFKRYDIKTIKEKQREILEIVRKSNCSL